MELQRQSLPKPSAREYLAIPLLVGRNFKLRLLCDKVLTSNLLVFRWSECSMIAVILEALDQPDDPLHELAKEMKWNIRFTTYDVGELQKFMKIMGPINVLFGQLNCDTKSSLHLVYPSVKVYLS